MGDKTCELASFDTAGKFRFVFQPWIIWTLSGQCLLIYWMPIGVIDLRVNYTMWFLMTICRSEGIMSHVGSVCELSVKWPPNTFECEVAMHKLCYECSMIYTVTTCHFLRGEAIEPLHTQFFDALLNSKLPCPQKTKEGCTCHCPWHNVVRSPS